MMDPGGQACDKAETQDYTAREGPSIESRVMHENTLPKQIGNGLVMNAIGDDNLVPNAIDDENLGLKKTVGDEKIVPKEIGHDTLVLKAINDENLVLEKTVGDEKIGPKQIGDDTLAPHEIGGDNLAPNAIGYESLVPNEIGSDNLAPNDSGDDNLVPYVTGCENIAPKSDPAHDEGLEGDGDGANEWASLAVQGQVYVTKNCLELKLRTATPPEARHAAWTLTTYQKDNEELTAHQEIRREDLRRAGNGLR